MQRRDNIASPHATKNFPKHSPFEPDAVLAVVNPFRRELAIPPVVKMKLNNSASTMRAVWELISIHGREALSYVNKS